MEDITKKRLVFFSGHTVIAECHNRI